MTADRDRDEPLDEGGDPACWAHLFEEDEPREDGSEGTVPRGD